MALSRRDTKWMCVVVLLLLYMYVTLDSKSHPQLFEVISREVVTSHETEAVGVAKQEPASNISQQTARQAAAARVMPSSRSKPVEVRSIQTKSGMHHYVQHIFKWSELSFFDIFIYISHTLVFE